MLSAILFSEAENSYKKNILIYKCAIKFLEIFLKIQPKVEKMYKTSKTW